MHDLLINISNEENIAQIVHLLIDYLLEVPKTDATRAKLASALNVPSTGDDLTVTLKLVEALFRQYCLNEISAAELKSHFSNLGPAMQANLVEVLDQRRGELAQFMINEINASSSGNPLMESFDWDVKWIMGNSSLASTREQIVTMALNCRGNDLRLKTVRFEMNREKVAEMIRVLEECSGCGVDK